jgi:hypothetical protein
MTLAVSIGRSVFVGLLSVIGLSFIIDKFVLTNVGESDGGGVATFGRVVIEELLALLIFAIVMDGGRRAQFLN